MSEGQPHEREERILNATHELVLRYGFDKTTVSDIAREAGISKGAIYLHHASKDDLLEALLWREIWKYVEYILEYLEDETQPWSFVGMYQKAIEFMSTNALMRAILQGDKRIIGSFMQRRGAKMGEFKRPYQVQLLNMMQQAGTIRADLDVEAATYLLNMMNYGFLAAHDNIPEEMRPPMEIVVEQMAEMLQRFLLPADGGNQEAGRQIMLEITRAMRQQFKQQMINEE